MIVDSAHYKDGVRQHEEALTPERAAELRGSAGAGEFVWIGIHEPAPGDLEQLQRLFGLHELAVEDAQQAHQRPKIEDYGEHVFVVLKTAHYHEDREEVHFGEIHLFAGPGYVITVRHGPGSELATARQRLEARPDLVKLGASSAVWAVLDKVVDDYIPVVDSIEDDIEEVEKDVFDDDNPAPTERIYHLKREVIEFHRAVWPLLNPLETLEQGGFERVPEELRSFFRDVADHARRVDEQVSGSARALDQRAPGEPVPGQRQPERGGEEDLGDRGNRRRTDLHRLGLRHELRPHARVALAVWVSAVSSRDGAGRAWRWSSSSGGSTGFRSPPESYDAADSRRACRGPGVRATSGCAAHPGRDRLRLPAYDPVPGGPAGSGLEGRLLRIGSGADRDRLHLAARPDRRRAPPRPHDPAPADG